MNQQQTGTQAPRRPTVEQVEEVLGISHTGWDLIDPDLLIDTILRLAIGPRQDAAGWAK